jgi:hypothetical protein
VVKEFNEKSMPGKGGVTFSNDVESWDQPTPETSLDEEALHRQGPMRPGALHRQGFRDLGPMGPGWCPEAGDSVQYHEGDGTWVFVAVVQLSTNVGPGEEPEIAVQLANGQVRDTSLARLRPATARVDNGLRKELCRPCGTKIVDVTFAEPGKLGIIFKAGFTPVTIAKIVPGQQATRRAYNHPQLLPGMVLKTVQGESVEWVPYKAVLSMIGAAGRPLTLSFISTMTTEAGPLEFHADRLERFPKDTMPTGVPVPPMPSKKHMPSEMHADASIKKSTHVHDDNDRQSENPDPAKQVFSMPETPTAEPMLDGWRANPLASSTEFVESGYNSDDSETIYLVCPCDYRNGSTVTMEVEGSIVDLMIPDGVRRGEIFNFDDAEILHIREGGANSSDAGREGDVDAEINVQPAQYQYQYPQTGDGVKIFHNKLRQWIPARIKNVDEEYIATVIYMQEGKDGPKKYKKSVDTRDVAIIRKLNGPDKPRPPRRKEERVENIEGRSAPESSARGGTVSSSEWGARQEGDGKRNGKGVAPINGPDGARAEEGGERKRSSRGEMGKLSQDTEKHERESRRAGGRRASSRKESGRNSAPPGDEDSDEDAIFLKMPRDYARGSTITMEVSGSMIDLIIPKWVKRGRRFNLDDAEILDIRDGSDDGDDNSSTGSAGAEEGELSIMDVECPEGAVPGDELEVETFDGESIEVVVPLGVRPGGTWTVSIPSKQPGNSKGPTQRVDDQGATAPPTVSIVCPDGVTAGDMIGVEVSGQTKHVVIPHGVAPGDEFQVDWSSLAEMEQDADSYDGNYGSGTSSDEGGYDDDDYVYHVEFGGRSEGGEDRGVESWGAKLRDSVFKM